MGGVGAVAGPLGWLPLRLGLRAPSPGPWNVACAPTRAGSPNAELRCSSGRGGSSAPRWGSRRGSGVKLRQRRRRRRRRPREELQEEERRRQRVRFSAATLSQARLVPPPPEASALAPRLPPARPLPGSGPARRRSHPRRGCQAWGSGARGISPSPTLGRPPACAWVGHPPLQKETAPVRPPPAFSAAVPWSPLPLAPLAPTLAL